MKKYLVMIALCFVNATIVYPVEFPHSTGVVADNKIELHE